MLYHYFLFGSYSWPTSWLSTISVDVGGSSHGNHYWLPSAGQKWSGRGAQWEGLQSMLVWTLLVRTLFISALTAGLSPGRKAPNPSSNKSLYLVSGTLTFHSLKCWLTTLGILKGQNCLLITSYWATNVLKFPELLLGYCYCREQSPVWRRRVSQCLISI